MILKYKRIEGWRWLGRIKFIKEWAITTHQFVLARDLLFGYSWWWRCWHQRTHRPYWLVMREHGWGLIGLIREAYLQSFEALGKVWQFEELPWSALSRFIIFTLSLILYEYCSFGIPIATKCFFECFYGFALTATFRTSNPLRGLAVLYAMLFGLCLGWPTLRLMRLLVLLDSWSKMWCLPSIVAAFVSGLFLFLGYVLDKQVFNETHYTLHFSKFLVNLLNLLFSFR